MLLSSKRRMPYRSRFAIMITHVSTTAVGNTFKGDPSSKSFKKKKPTKPTSHLVPPMALNLEHQRILEECAISVKHLGTRG